MLLNKFATKIGKKSQFSTLITRKMRMTSGKIEKFYTAILFFIFIIMCICSQKKEYNINSHRFIYVAVCWGGWVSAFEWCVLFLVAQCVLLGVICDKILAI